MNSKRKILITDSVHPLLYEGLRADGFMVDYLPDITALQVAEVIAAYEGLVINSKVYAGNELFNKAPLLKFVCRAGSGLEVIDIEYAKQKGIAAFNSPEGNRNAVAEHALGMLLCLLNNIVKANTEVKSGQWNREENRGTELAGKTIGLMAYGNTAEAFAKLLGSFDVRILAYDKYRKNFANEHVKEASPQEIAREADVLSLHLPLTPETEYMIDYAFLSSFKKKFWLLNTSRGKVLRTAHLIKCINEGRIYGAALDVLENEKLQTLNEEEQDIFQKLAADKRILLTPHIAGWTHESKQKIAEILLQKIRALYQAI
ncbi:MAG: hydroxyacid dehydrogenase [Chitinophagales bacterium]|nr:hydroxyacid dehydrogenase [Chitinophagales bacterium]